MTRKQLAIFPCVAIVAVGVAMFVSLPRGERGFQSIRPEVYEVCGDGDVLMHVTYGRKSNGDYVMPVIAEFRDDRGQVWTMVIGGPRPDQCGVWRTEGFQVHRAEVRRVKSSLWMDGEQQTETCRNPKPIPIEISASQPTTTSSPSGPGR